MMNCPVCKSELVEDALETNLQSFKCAQCGGRWIAGREFWRWLERHGANLPERREPPSDAVAPEDQTLKVCPGSTIKTLR